MSVTVSFPVRSAFCEMPDPVCVHRAESVLLRKGVDNKDEDVGQGRCNREMPNF